MKSDMGSNSAEGDPCSLGDIVVHTETVRDILKTYVSITPYNRSYKDKFFCTEEKTVVKMIDDICYA